MTHDLSAAAFRKSTHSAPNGDACVEVARNLPGIVAVRDSKHADLDVLVFAPAAFRAMTTGIKND
ncbi:hypothetical protein GCM10027589_15510 [Actinocorallia lasiicapitis]